jgi:hypothetical protein
MNSACHVSQGLLLRRAIKSLCHLHTNPFSLQRRASGCIHSVGKSGHEADKRQGDQGYFPAATSTRSKCQRGAVKKLQIDLFCKSNSGDLGSQ